MKNIKFKIFSAVAGALALVGCRDVDYGEKYNQDVYGIYSSDYKSLLSGAIMDFGQNGGNASNVYQMMPQLFVQYQSQVVYTTEQTYGDTPGAWARYYVNQMQNLNKIIKDYANPTAEMQLQGSKENMVGTSMIFRSIIIKRVTDTYGDAPFSEANQVDEGNFTPKYDKQVDIYKQLISDLKAGRDMIGTGAAPTGDILYFGNMTRWKKLANSVILQATLQLSKKYPAASDYAATEYNAALNNSAGVIEQLADEAWFTINPTASYPNPYSGFRAADYRISRELVESLKGSTNNFNRTSNHTLDRRLSLYATAGLSAVGLPYGYNTADLGAAGYSASTATTISTRFRSNNSPINLMTAGYTYLNRADAAARGWSTENAAAMLTLGIQRNYQMLDAKYVTGVAPFTGTAISTGANLTTMNAYIAARVADMAAFGADRVIGEEKWVALFMNGFDAWAEWRRTNYPNLLPAPSALNGGVIPRRMRYPQEEINFNNANYLQGVATLSPPEDKNTSKIWWDQ